MKIISFKEFVQACDPKREVTMGELKQLEKYLDSVWKSLGIDVEFTRHFFDRINDPRNKQQITICEIQKLFIDTYKKYGRNIKSLKGAEAVISDMQTDVNVPFALKYNSRTRDLELVSKTVMRKKNFVPNSANEKQLKV